MTPTQTIILEVLAGRELPIKRRELLKVIHEHQNSTELSDRKMRLEIESLIKDCDIAIQSSERGYQLIKSSKQLNEAVIYLDLKSKSISIRRNFLKRNFELMKKMDYKFIQPELFAN